MTEKSRKKKNKKRKFRLSKKNDATSQRVRDSGRTPTTPEEDSLDSEQCEEVSGCCQRMFGRRYERGPAGELPMDDKAKTLPVSKDGIPSSAAGRFKDLHHLTEEVAEEPEIELFEAVFNLCKPRAKLYNKEDILRIKTVYRNIDNYINSVLIELYNNEPNFLTKYGPLKLFFERQLLIDIIETGRFNVQDIHVINITKDEMSSRENIKIFEANIDRQIGNISEIVDLKPSNIACFSSIPVKYVQGSMHVTRCKAEEFAKLMAFHNFPMITTQSVAERFIPFIKSNTPFGVRGLQTSKQKNHTRLACKPPRSPANLQPESYNQRSVIPIRQMDSIFSVISFKIDSEIHDFVFDKERTQALWNVFQSSLFRTSRTTGKETVDYPNIRENRNINERFKIVITLRDKQNIQTSEVPMTLVKLFLQNLENRSILLSNPKKQECVHEERVAYFDIERFIPREHIKLMKRVLHRSEDQYLMKKRKSHRFDPRTLECMREDHTAYFHKENDSPVKLLKPYTNELGLPGKFPMVPVEDVHLLSGTANKATVAFEDKLRDGDITGRLDILITHPDKIRVLISGIPTTHVEKFLQKLDKQSIILKKTSYRVAPENKNCLQEQTIAHSDNELLVRLVRPPKSELGLSGKFTTVTVDDKRLIEGLAKASPRMMITVSESHLLSTIVVKPRPNKLIFEHLSTCNGRTEKWLCNFQLSCKANLSARKSVKNLSIDLALNSLSILSEHVVCAASNVRKANPVEHARANNKRYTRYKPSQITAKTDGSNVASVKPLYTVETISKEPYLKKFEPSAYEYNLLEDIFQTDIPEFQIFRDDVPKNLDHILIPFKEISGGTFDSDNDVGIVVDSGDFGETVHGRMTEFENKISIKLLQNTKPTEVEREAKIQQYLRPGGYVPNLIGIVGKPTGTEFVMLQEFCATGLCHHIGNTLYDVIQACLDEKLILFKRHWLSMCLNLATSLQDMHELGVLHNDIRPENIWIDLNMPTVMVYYTDFGKATFRRGRILPLTLEIEDSDFQKEHLAPEVCQYMPSSPASDIYSLGKIFEEIVKHFCDCLRSLPYHMCRDDPNDRLTLEEVLEVIDVIMTENDL